MEFSIASAARPALIVEPYFSPRLWGSRDLRPFYPDLGNPPEPIGEAWLSADRCRLRGEPATLGEIAAARPEIFGRLPGEPARGFPLLVKLLFPCDFLSVQVHPDDAYARRHGFGIGKTEMWHVLRAEPGARVGLNLAPGKSLADLAAGCRQGRSRELLQWWEAAPGDSFFVPAGTVHALGPGLVLCEVQQASDTTFRLDDFGRRDASGQLRELHWEHGLAVARPRTAAGRVGRNAASRGGTLASCEYFHVEKRVLEGEPALVPAAFRILVPLAGSVSLAQRADAPVPLPLAHAAVLPADAGPWHLAGRGQVLDVTLP